MSLLPSHRALLLCGPHLKDAGSDGLLRETKRSLADMHGAFQFLMYRQEGRAAAQVYSDSRQPYGAEEGERGSPSIAGSQARASKLQGSRKSLDGGWSCWASAGEQAPPEQSSAGATSNNVTRPANHISEDHMAHFGCEGLRVQAGGLCPAFCNLSVPRHQ